ncbi:uncharacterized protein LOC115887953 [Sitophilus oryzae]|uniref:Uncharacterized protein LOC115887953 n=1 Tax=Sitophilus oryzae TaxID=7048 RepID=A0A6J2YJQ8_SITOR|nr:uncharacterized protein LOC115887953 [Sitophilus oryzae]
MPKNPKPGGSKKSQIDGVKKARVSTAPRHPVSTTIIKFNLDQSPIICTVTEQEPSKNPAEIPRFKTGTLKTSLHGDIFQLRLLMLYLHRALKLYKNRQFYIATEMKAAEVFDDVVLLYQDESNEWVWRFLQAKHTLDEENNIVTKTNIFNSSKTLHGMALVKYLRSYCKIKRCETFEGARLDSFILCANHNFNEEAMKHLELDQTTVRDPILEFRGRKCKKYKLTIESKQELLDAYHKRYDSNEIQPTIEDLDEFFDKFRFMLEYPNKDELHKLINKEIGEEVKLLNPYFATNSFQEEVHRWFAEYKDGSSSYLVKEEGDKFFKKIGENIRSLMTSGLSKARPETLHNYAVSFNRNFDVLSRFLAENPEKNVQVMHIITDSTLLSSIKVAQCLKFHDYLETHDKCIFVRLEEMLVGNLQNLACEAFASKESHHLFVIECQKDTPINQDTLADLINNLDEILEENREDKENDSSRKLKKLILISNEDHVLFTKLTEMRSEGLEYDEVKDLNSFSHFDIKSKETMLEKFIMFQDELTKINKLINIKAAEEVLDLETIEMLLLQDEIEIEPVKVSKFDSFDKDMYETRTLYRQVADLDILNENLISTSLFFVRDIQRRDDDNLKAIKQKSIHEWNPRIRYTVGLILIPNGTDRNDIDQLYLNSETDMFFFEYSNKYLFLDDCKGNMRKIYPYVSNKCFSDHINENYLCSVVSDYKKRTNIVADNPGLGKSALIGSLAYNFKKLNPMLWVLKMNLNDYGFNPNSALNKNVLEKSLQEINFDRDNMKEAVRFLTDMVYPVAADKRRTCFQKRFLEFALNQVNLDYKYPKVALLFDGFDEISPNYKENTLILLQALKKSRAEYIWVTSRRHEQSSLERDLESVAYHLNPFSETQKLNFMKKVWRKSGKSDADFDEAYDRIKTVIYQRLWGGIQVDFNGVPLQLKMLTDVMVWRSGELPENFELSSLYKIFIEEKFRIYYTEKSVAGRSAGAEEMRSRDEKLMIILHQDIAFESFFSVKGPSDKLRESFEQFKTDLHRIGLVVVNKTSDRSFRFVHQSFGEYFLGNYLCLNMERPEVRQVLFKEVLWEARFQAVRMFLDNTEMLQRQLRRYASKELSDLANGDKSQKQEVFYRMVDEKNVNLLSCIYEKVKFSK